MQASTIQEFTMEEEMELLERMVQQQPYLILEPIAEPTTETSTEITTLPTTSATTSSSTATNTRKRPDIQLRKVQKVKYHLVKKVKPYDPTKPGFKRPTKRPVIRPASAEIIKLAKPVKATTNPGPLVISGPQSTAELVGESPRGKHNDPTSTNLDTGHVSSKEQLDNDDAFPARATASFPKKKRRIGGQRRESTATNPGPLVKSSPQLGKLIKKVNPVIRNEATTTTRPIKVIVTNPGPFRRNGPQLATIEPGKTKKGLATNPGPSSRDSLQLATTINAGWIDYDDAPLLADYPEYVESSPEDLFPPPKKVQTPLQRLLAALTPLAEVRPKTVAKKASFTAYDETLRVYKVTRYVKGPTPKIEPTGKTVWDMLARLREREE
ncbi:uncharacterized protein LOC130677677 [Microplitis mediator]|uniref:uncharacterized protein LOC130677677 n=1 Tax=Microplitis mediator TaxID=375433 RepID=UPI0025527015|nr:uncharacterized protein LOC130677677 [Microplitis mediator]